MGEVKAFRGVGEFPKEMLIEIAENPDLIAVQIVGHWKATEKSPEGSTTVGWTDGLNSRDMIFGARHLMLRSDEIALGDE